MLIDFVLRCVHNPISHPLSDPLSLPELQLYNCDMLSTNRDEHSLLEEELIVERLLRASISPESSFAITASGKYYLHTNRHASSMNHDPMVHTH